MRALLIIAMLMPLTTFAHQGIKGLAFNLHLNYENSKYTRLIQELDVASQSGEHVAVLTEKIEVTTKQIGDPNELDFEITTKVTSDFDMASGEELNDITEFSRKINLVVAAKAWQKKFEAKLDELGLEGSWDGKKQILTLKRNGEILANWFLPIRGISRNIPETAMAGIDQTDRLKEILVGANYTGQTYSVDHNGGTAE